MGTGESVLNIDAARSLPSMFSPGGISLNGSWSIGDEEEQQAREAEAEAFRYVQEIGSDDDQPRVTRQDILHNRLEQAECAAIELRLESRHREAVDKLEECLSLTRRLAGRNSAAAWRAANQVAMACNTAGATLLKQSYERSRYDEAFGLLQRAVYVTEPVDHPKRIALRAATQRILSLATKRTNRKSASKSKWGQRQSSSSPIKSPNKSPIKSPQSPTLNSTASRQSRAYVHSTSPRPQQSPSRKRDAGPQLGLEVGCSSVKMTHKYPCDPKSPGGRRKAAASRNEVRWEQYQSVISGGSPMDAMNLNDHEEEVWNQMQQYWALQQKLEQEFLETLEGPAVNMCGLTPQQLVEMQTRDLSPEDYDMLLALDEQIAKKTVDQSEIDGYESRPVTPSLEGSSCSVCMCDFEPDESVKVLPCKHLFHKECIAKWLSECNTSCPNCGVDVGVTKAAAAAPEQ